LLSDYDSSEEIVAEACRILTAIQPAGGLDGQIRDRAENPLFKIYAPSAGAADIDQAVRD